MRVCVSHGTQFTRHYVDQSDMWMGKAKLMIYYISTHPILKHFELSSSKVFCNFTLIYFFAVFVIVVVVIVLYDAPPKSLFEFYYSDVIMGAIGSQIASLTIVHSTVYPDADPRKHQSSASLAFVRGIHRGPVNSPHKWPVTQKMFPFDDVIVSGWGGVEQANLPSYKSKSYTRFQRHHCSLCIIPAR